MIQTKIKYSKMVILGIALGVSLLVYLACESGVLRAAEQLSLDYRYYINSITPRIAEQFSLFEKNVEGDFFVGRKRDGGKSDSPVVLIDVPASGSDIRTCLPADICADLVKILSLSGARMIMLNSVLSDPLSDSGYISLGNMIKASKNVYLPILYELDKNKMDLLYTGDGVNGVLEPKPEFYGDRTKLGFINAFADNDKRLRRIPAVIRYSGRENYYIGLKMVFDYIGVPPRNIKFDPDNHVIALSMPSGATNTIPLEKDNQLLINWGSAEKSPLVHYRHRDILESYGLRGSGLGSIIDLNVFSGKICIIGTTESNKNIGKPVVVEGDYATSGACAMVINSVLKTRLVKHSPWGFNIAVIFLVPLIVVNSIMSRKILSVMMITVLSAASLMTLYIYGMSSALNLIVAVGLSIVLGIIFASFSIFSGFIFTVLSAMAYLIVSMGVFKLFNIDIITFYPILAMFAMFFSFYAYTRLLGYMSSVQLFNMAAKDGLTGLYNRRHLNMLLDSEIANMAANKGRLSIVMCDIDNFKKLNDTHGHQAGDAILKEFAKILSSKCRKSDIVARYGGEEFMVILVGAGFADALKVAESMRQAIEAKSFVFKGQNYHTTLSMGLVESTNEKTKEELIEKADQALYRAKKEGKNRVVVYQ